MQMCFTCMCMCMCMYYSFPLASITPPHEHANCPK